jgi:DNA recombination protein RmuC
MQQFDLLSLILGLFIGIILVLINRMTNSRRTEEIRNQLHNSQTLLKVQEEKSANFENEFKHLNLKLDARQEEVQALISENAALLNTVQNVKEQLQMSSSQILELKNTNQRQLDDISSLKQKLSEFQSQNHYLQIEFQNIANKILEEKSIKFTESNKENINNLLKPLGENLHLFKKQVEETYDKESKQRFSLEERIKELVDLNYKLSKEAQDLTSALKGETKKQGNWGEIILESILEKSGLEKNREYKVQVSIQNEEGRRLQPDIIVYLPESRTIIIDSKVSLVAYDRFAAADTKEEQDLALKAHIKSMYLHIDQLGDKRYDTVAGTLDFTMMFIPIEPAYLIAMKYDPELWAYAYAKRILLISPTNLIAALKLIADLWKREQQSKNAMAIAKQGERLYDKMVGFLESMDDVGKHLNRSQESYSKAIGQLRDGKGSLVKQAQKMKKLGLNSQKEIPDSLLPFDDDMDDAEET